MIINFLIYYVLTAMIVTMINYRIYVKTEKILIRKLQESCKKPVKKEVSSILDYFLIILNPFNLITFAVLTPFYIIFSKKIEDVFNEALDVYEKDGKIITNFDLDKATKYFSKED